MSVKQLEKQWPKPVSTSGSDYPSQAASKSARPGTRRIRSSIATVLEEARKKTIACGGNFARANAHVVAMCASEGYITTREAAGLFTRSWMITAEGVHHLNRMKEAEQNA